MKTPKELALLAARALSDKKGKEIRVMEIAELDHAGRLFRSGHRRQQYPDQRTGRQCGKAAGRGGW